MSASEFAGQPGATQWPRFLSGDHEPGGLRGQGLEEAWEIGIERV